MKLKCLAIDDESLGRKLLEENILQIPFLDLVATCKNAFAAMEILQKEPVDLIFSDIQMPGMLGTKFIQSLREKPMVIFVTAYSQYAVESYDLEVVDYLVKPVSMERFIKAAYKALEIYRLKQQSSNPSIIIEKAADHQYFFVNVEYSLVKVPIPDITYIEGMKDYVKIYLDSVEKPIITKATLKSIEEKLPENGFMRVHKSFIVHLEKIEAIRNHRLKIQNSEIPVSESNLEDLLKRLKYSK